MTFILDIPVTFAFYLYLFDLYTSETHSDMSNSFVTPWTVSCQAPLSMGFSMQEYWRGLPFPCSGDLPDPGIEPLSPALADRFFTTEPSGKHPGHCQCSYKL